MFKIPIEDLHQHSMCGISKWSKHANMLHLAQLIIWDEAGNQSQYAMEAVDCTLQDICGSCQPFGGIATVFGGDFRQTLPVVRQGA
jgi:hypothetical protein